MGFNDNIPSIYTKAFSQLHTHVVVYRPASGNPLTGVYAIVSYGVHENTHGIKGDGAAWQLTLKKNFRHDFRNFGTNDVATIQILTSDVPAPKYGDEVEIDGETWGVVEVCDHA